MANKQIVDYIKDADNAKLKKGEIIDNLKQAGWDENAIKDAFAYVNLYSQSLYENIPDKRKPVAQVTMEEQSRKRSWLGLVALVVGYLWLISGLNKIISGNFVSGFADFLRGQIQNGQLVDAYKNFLNNFVLPNAQVIATLTQYSELAIGISLVVAGFWNFIRANKFMTFVLCLASVGSFLLILNLILTLGLPLPLLETQNAFAEGMNVQYMTLLLSFVLALANFYEL